jgi:hypothetical protein
MRRQSLMVAAAAFAVLGAWPAAAHAQDADDVRAITARVRGTFEDASGGLGVVSGDMTVVRFEIRNGTLTAIGAIVGAMADSTGRIVGPVNQEVAKPVGGVDSSCNQLRMDLGENDADVLQVRVHFDKEVAGFDSREGTTPKALGALCAAGQLLRQKPGAVALATALNDFATALAAGSVR